MYVISLSDLAHGQHINTRCGINVNEKTPETYTREVRLPFEAGNGP